MRTSVIGTQLEAQGTNIAADGHIIHQIHAHHRLKNNPVKNKFSAQTSVLGKQILF
jgi:hypothetical protein